MRANGPIAYDKATLKSRNPLARLAHANRFSVALELVRRFGGPDASVLDFGAGDGAFLRALGASGHRGPRYGYDAFKAPAGDGIIPLSELGAPPAGGYQVITALETLEHLFPDAVEHFLSYTEGALAPGGHLIVSVPIMVGPVLFVKYANARFINRSRWRYSVGELVNGGIRLAPVARETGGAMMSHKGFDFRVLRERLLRTRLALVHESYSPFPRLWFGFNSQAFFVLRKAI